MIQIVLMDGRKFINKHKSFKEKDVDKISDYIAAAMRDDDHSIIEISKWKRGGQGLKIPARLERK